MSVSQPPAYDWYPRWQEHGLMALAIRAKSGRPRKVDDNYISILEKVIDQDPQELGYTFTLWTMTRLRLHLEKETGILIGKPNLMSCAKKMALCIVAPSMT